MTGTHLLDCLLLSLVSRQGVRRQVPTAQRREQVANVLDDYDDCSVDCERIVYSACARRQLEQRQHHNWRQ